MIDGTAVSCSHHSCAILVMPKAGRVAVNLAGKLLAQCLIDFVVIGFVVSLS